ncbi:TonB-dependent receptor [Tenacibaculum holothuriorum]|uniref:TonB-dependent receptor n=1 Tax=Tenacibaculum holothuriorum TaxID=1635173 RepID=A0A1Y2PBI7_9FLAO|nr:carboxypeptidase-like regulatory domain-containing protein [Tenacibaculum holothuriorum]OSY87119.1 TonB-dependent receptor [Tenacibaculum holothuriorum]
MRKFNNLLLVALFFISATVLGQTKLTGTVVDEMGEPLPGASVLVKGTSNGAASDFNGEFMLNSNSNSGIVVVSFVGYTSKEVAYTSAKTNLGTIQLEMSNLLGEVVIQGVIDVAKDRQTPVAASTIKAAVIQEKLGSQEFPEVLKSTPSVYATKSGGGFGDARINIRGFDQRNTAVLINGVPVNDMENGWVYWSNWAGLSDVTSAMQVQRGLGSSKLAISSVGGTINVITRTANQKEGGAVAASFGNDGYMKYKASYSTGKLDNGLSASVLLSRTQGDGYVDGTKFLGHNYFLAFGYEINDAHSLEFTFTGAPQWHHQRSWAETISTYQRYGEGGVPNIKYNAAWGYLNGEEFSFRRNFYHKPVMSLNYDWKINESSKLSSILYASWGRGGGTGPIGSVGGIRDFDSRLRDANGIVRFDDIVKWNSGQSGHGFGIPDRTGGTVNDRRNGLTRRASMNSHNWYGIIANFHNDANENLSWDLGVDLRTYKGIHYRVVNNILGATGYTDNRDSNNPNRNITDFVEASPSFNPWQSIADQQKIEYYNDGDVNWLGAFGQVEYKNDDISTFIQAGVSRQGFQRVDYFNLAPADQKSGFKNIWGGNVKGGINWNINEKHNVFGNAGYYSKQPLFDGVYTSFRDNRINPFLSNEKILGIEAGYGFKSENYNVKLNLYRTSWKDRFLRANGSARNNFIQVSGVEQVHMGAELETTARFGNLTIESMLSIGDYEYKGTAVGTEYDQDNTLVRSNVPFYLDGVKVGDAAQTTARIGFTYKVSEGLKFDISQFYASRLYSRINPSDFTTLADNAKGSLQLPGHSLMDAGVSYKWKLGDKKSINFRFNVNNLTNETYISDGFTNIHADGSNPTYNGIDVRNRVYFGFGRTWNGSIRFNF